MKIHGGMRFVGNDAEVSNLTLEIETTDPALTHEGHVWYNTEEERIKYVESKNNQMTKRSLATLDDLNADRQNSAINAGSRSLVFGQPVFSSPSGINEATAGDSLKRNVIGLVCQDQIAVGVEGAYQFRDLLTGTIEQWNDVTNSSVGLIPNSQYFLSVESGKLTFTPPSVEGQSICFIGIAVSSTSLLINIQRPIQL